MIAKADDEIKLTSGSIASLKSGGIGMVEINLDDTKFDNKEPLRQDSRFSNVDKDVPEYKREFVREFNENTKLFKMTENPDSAQYVFNVNITNLDVYVSVMSFKGGVGIKLWGDIVIKEKATGTEVAIFVIDEENNSGMTYSVALEEGFEGIAKYLAKRIKKGK